MNSRRLIISLLTVVVIIALVVGVILYGNDTKPDTTITKQPDNTAVDTQKKPVDNSKTKKLTVYYMAINDDGRSGTMIGCNDSLVATTTAPITFTDQLKASFDQLLANHNQYVGEAGLYNALYQSELSYKSGSSDGTTATVYLTGKTMLGGVCDIPRVEAQLEELAKKAAGTTKAVIYVNDTLLSEHLSLK